jgi:acetyltransferase-like isoleucine patch superfamily enzyme
MHRTQADNKWKIKSAPVIIDKGVFIGTGCTILKGVHIGEKSVVAAGSIVTKSIPKNELWGYTS